ncbi:hypothetical protein [Streptomyces sp. NPDC020965]|uniref:hypothetical protein n=1 Tax=Streptomyces sp. NPDC020965 TaxID=3365105 RepID=UPI0037890AFB
MSTTTEPSATLLEEVALIACGRREGKTRPCRSCAGKAPDLWTIASSGARDAVAEAICGGHGGACQDCRAKAEIISTAVGVPCTA